MQLVKLFTILAAVEAAYISKHRTNLRSPQFVRKLSCVDMVKLNGAFYFKKTDDDESKSCAVFFIGEIDEVLRLSMIDMSIKNSSDSSEFIKFYDGWNINGMIIPKEEPMSKQPELRFEQTRDTFDSTHNAAMIVFKLKRNSSFKINLHTNRAIESCGAIIPRPTGVYSMQGGKGQTCSMHLIYPAEIIVRSLFLQQYKSNKKRTKAIIKTGKNFKKATQLKTFKRSLTDGSKRISGSDYSIITLQSQNKIDYIEFELREKVRARNRVYRSNSRP